MRLDGWSWWANSWQRCAVQLDRLSGVVFQRLPQRWHTIAHELAKFGTIGVINLVVNFAIFNLLFLTVLRGGELKAKAAAAIVATTCAYFMNRHWTYRDRPKSTLRREYSLFFFFNLVGLIIEVGIVGITKYGLHQTHIIAFNISTAIGIGLGTLFRFWAYRTHVFKQGLDTESELTPTGVNPADADLAAVDLAAVDLAAVNLATASATGDSDISQRAAVEPTAEPAGAKTTTGKGPRVKVGTGRNGAVTTLSPRARRRPRRPTTTGQSGQKIDEIELDALIAAADRQVRTNSLTPASKE